MGPNTGSYEYSVQISAFQSFRIQNVDLKTIFHCSSSIIHRAAETAVHRNITFFLKLYKYLPMLSIKCLNIRVPSLPLEPLKAYTLSTLLLWLLYFLPYSSSRSFTTSFAPIFKQLFKPNQCLLVSIINHEH